MTRAAIGADGTRVFEQRYPAAGTPNVLVSENLDAAPTSDGKLLSLALGARSFAWIALD